jgi:hypothetical protein
MMNEMMKGLNLPPNYSIAMLPIMFRISQLRDKEEIAAMVEKLSQPPPEHPKISLNLVWSELNQVEKATFANLMGQPLLAKHELEAGDAPAHQIKEKGQILREEIKAGAKEEKKGLQ